MLGEFSVFFCDFQPYDNELLKFADKAYKHYSLQEVFHFFLIKL